MEIETFVAQSEGEWNSMRSGHSLAFKQFEEIVSNIKVKLLSNNDQNVRDLLHKSDYSNSEPLSPFEIKWAGESDWNNEKDNEDLKGSSLLIPIPSTNNTGVILRSSGYAEKIQAVSSYYFLSDGTIVLSTKYEKTFAEERIWFVNENLRCRSSVIKSINRKAILQTSFASELRRLKV